MSLITVQNLANGCFQSQTSCSREGCLASVFNNFCQNLGKACYSLFVSCLSKNCQQSTSWHLIKIDIVASVISGEVPATQRTVVQKQLRGKTGFEENNFPLCPCLSLDGGVGPGLLCRRQCSIGSNSNHVASKFQKRLYSE